MDHRVRDLDQIQEDDGDERARRLGTILMACAAILGLSLALGVVVGRAAEPAAKLDDPLAKLERSAAANSAAPRAAPQQEPPAPKVEAADLSFPTTLTEDEERPEVLAALSAAKAEAAGLAEPEPQARARSGVQAAPAAQAATPAIVAHAQADDDDDDDDTADAPPSPNPATPAKASVTTINAEDMIANIPAAVAAGAGTRNLRKAARHDPLVAAAVHSDQPKLAAPQGRDGEFTLQVISYDRQEASRAFAEGLRAKGHMAFVVTADVPERGRYYRVRLGPFKNREQAEAYRHKFEEQEHMNTFVVHDKERQSSPPAP